MAHVFRTTTFFFGIFSLVGMLMVGGGFEKAYAGGNPPTGTEKVTGFALQAVTTGQTAFYDSQTGLVLMPSPSSSWVTVGACKGVPFAFPANFNFPIDGSITAGKLRFQRIKNAGPAGCYSVLGGETLIITNVQKFNNTGDEIGAEIHLQQVSSGK